MDKEDFKIEMKNIFEEAMEEYSKQGVHIPHPYIKYECPECNQKLLDAADYPTFKCNKCKSVVVLRFITLEKGKEE